MVMYRANTLQTSGNMQQRKQFFTFMLTILASNTFPIPMLIIYWIPLKIITESPWTWKGTTTVDWPLPGITTRNMSEFPCKLTSPNTSNFFYTLPPKSMLCNPQIYSAIICPKQSVLKRTRQHPTSGWKRQKRHKIQGQVFTLLLTSIWSTHVTCFKNIVSIQAKPTLQTKLATNMMLDCAHTYPNVKINYHSRYMILHFKSDAAYLVMPKACSCITGYYYLSEHPTNPTNH